MDKQQLLLQRTMDGQGSTEVSKEPGSLGAAAMELEVAELRNEAFADAFILERKGRGSGFQPQHLGYLSAVIDALLFTGAGVTAAHWFAPPISDFFRFAQLLAIALLLALF